MKKGVCESCLNIPEDLSLKCSCGHETDPAVAERLYSVLREVGKKHIKMILMKDIRRVISKSGELKNYSVYRIPAAVDEEAFFDSIKFDVDKFVKDTPIERIGRAIVRGIIKDKKEELEKALGQEVDSVVAARVIAYLYDGKADKHAKVVVQKISDLGIKKYYLGGNVAAKNNTDLLYSRDGEPLFTVVGNAKSRPERRFSTYLIRLSDVSYPLVIIYRPKKFKLARLFIFL